MLVFDLTGKAAIITGSSCGVRAIVDVGLSASHPFAKPRKLGETTFRREM